MSADPSHAAAPPAPDYFHLGVDYAGVLMMLCVSLVAWLGFHLKGADLVLAGTWGLVVGSGGAVAASLVVRRKLAILPAVYGTAALLFGGATLSGFAWVMLFGIVVGTSSSIFIAAPILLFLGENRLRRDARAPEAVTAKG